MKTIDRGGAPVSTPAGPHFIIGGMIRTARLEADLSQVQLADKLGISNVHLCNIERGHQNVSVGLLATISKALGRKLVITFKKEKAK